MAADGEAGLARIASFRPDVIVLDLMMPNLDGFSFMETISANDPSRMGTIIVTSAASPSVIRDRLAGQPFAVLPKPFDIAQLVEHVRACIAARHSSAGSRPA